jgi:hypothetical protein
MRKITLKVASRENELDHRRWVDEKPGMFQKINWKRHQHVLYVCTVCTVVYVYDFYIRPEHDMMTSDTVLRDCTCTSVCQRCHCMLCR